MRNVHLPGDPVRAGVSSWRRSQLSAGVGRDAEVSCRAGVDCERPTVPRGTSSLQWDTGRHPDELAVNGLQILDRYPRRRNDREVQSCIHWFAGLPTPMSEPPTLSPMSGDELLYGADPRGERLDTSATFGTSQPLTGADGQSAGDAESPPRPTDSPGGVPVAPGGVPVAPTDAPVSPGGVPVAPGDAPADVITPAPPAPSGSKEPSPREATAPGGTQSVPMTSDVGQSDVAESDVEQSVESPVQPGRPLPRVIAVANQKGGVGKTTTTVNLGAALAELDYRVLIIDLDPQGNATTGLGVDHRSLTFTVYDLLLNDVPADECIEPTDLKGLFVIGANLDLAGAEVELVNQMSRETRLKRTLDDVIPDFDYVLIDCPPSLGLLTVNAFVAASEVLVPIQCEYYALEGLGQLTHNVDLVRKNLNPDLSLTTIVLVMYDARTNLSEQVASEVRAHFGPKVCRNIVPRNIRLSEAPSFGQPITVFDPSSRGAVAYRELAREVSSGS